MAISAAKLEANRRNALKSTGPRTQAGKDRSKMNAVTHGCRAETLVLPEEDPQELEDRRAAWTASLGPRCELEQRAVHDAVIYSWRQDRARRAEARRAHARLEELSDEEPRATAEQEAVLELGRRLFTDRMGPLTFYPATADAAILTTLQRRESTSFPRTDDEEPDIPEVLALRLQSTLRGCEWLLAEWTKLKAKLDAGKPWIIADKLRAIRLLGRQPFDVLDDEDVALVYLAAHRLKPAHADWAWEILTEMNDKSKKQFRTDVASRGLEALKPATAAEARSELLALVARQTERLTAKAETHRDRERAKAARLVDLLCFDDSTGGERLRRFEINSGRGYSRAIDTFLKLRRAEAIGQLPMGPLSGAPLPDGDDVAAAIANPNAPNEPACASDVDISWALEYAPNERSTDRWENVTNEASAAEPEIDLSWALAIDTNKLHGIDGRDTNEPATATENTADDAVQSHRNLTNEPNNSSSQFVVNPLAEGISANKAGAASETNEAKTRRSSVFSSPSLGETGRPGENVTNQATAAGENETNEPTDDSAQFVISGFPEDGCGDNALGEAKTNEPTDACGNGTNDAICENATNEPGNCEIDRRTIPQPVAAEEAPESHEDAIKRIRRTREEEVREWNEQARKLAEAAMFARRAQRRERKSRNAGRAGQTENEVFLGALPLTPILASP